VRLNDLPQDLDDRLWEWAYFFRNRQRLESCRSIESRYKRHSDDFEKDGVGDVASIESRPTHSYRLPRALETHDVIQSLETKYKWALTYWYCYPGLQKHLTLRLMKKYVGSWLKWKDFLEVKDIGRIRVHALLIRSS
jgi:hypothetical protein